MALALVGMEALYLFLDVDALDQLFAHLTGTLVWRGLTLREGNFNYGPRHETGSAVGMCFLRLIRSWKRTGLRIRL